MSQNIVASKVIIQKASEEFIPSFYECLDFVARERNYLELAVAPAFEVVKKFQMQLILIDGPIYYAIDKGKVVGWCDIFPLEHIDHKHRSRLGMGLLPEYCNMGLGSKLLSLSLESAKKHDFEKVELRVYANNARAKALYLKFGFEDEGCIKNYRKINGQYEDCFIMGKDLKKC